MHTAGIRKLLARAQVLHFQVRHDLAIPLLNEVIGLDPDCYEGLRMLSSSLRTVGRCIEAVVCARRLLVLRPDYAGSHAQLANILISTGENAEAISAAEEAVRLDPANPDHYWAIVSASYQDGDYSRSAQAARHALGLRPNQMELRLHLAMAVAALGQTSEAIRMIEANLNAWPNKWYAHVTTGWAYWHLGDFDRAALFFLEALRLNPQFPWQHEGLAYVRYTQGRRSEALQHFRDVDKAAVGRSEFRGSMRRLKRHLREFEDRDQL